MRKTSISSHFSARLFFGLISLFFILPILGRAQQAPSATGKQYETETDWPGILFQVIRLERILNNRLLVVIRIQATTKAPPSGTLIGTVPIIPAHTKKSDLIYFRPTPFSLEASTMIDELSQVSYPRLSSIAPPGRVNFPSGARAILHPGEMQLASLQFAAPPPPPPPPPGQKVVPQTLSFLLPKAKGPIIHVPLPPAEGAKAQGP